jgi:hypothetical protein
MIPNQKSKNKNMYGAINVIQYDLRAILLFVIKSENTNGMHKINIISSNLAKNRPQCIGGQKSTENG